MDAVAGYLSAVLKPRNEGPLFIPSLLTLRVVWAFERTRSIDSTSSGPPGSSSPSPSRSAPKSTWVSGRGALGDPVDLIWRMADFLGAPLQCWQPAQFTGGWEQYVHDYCFVENTYWLPLDDNIPDEAADRDERMLSYYQASTQPLSSTTHGADVAVGAVSDGLHGPPLRPPPLLLALRERPLGDPRPRPHQHRHRGSREPGGGGAASGGRPQGPGRIRLRSLIPPFIGRQRLGAVGFRESRDVDCGLL